MSDTSLISLITLIAFLGSAALTYMLYFKDEASPDSSNDPYKTYRDIHDAKLAAKQANQKPLLSDVYFTSPLETPQIPRTVVSSETYQQILNVKIKKMHKDAVIPKYMKSGDAGMDLTAVTKEFEINDAGQKLQVYDTGIAVEIPVGYVGLVFPRSSISKTGLIMTNHVGVIDSGFRGSIKQKFRIDGRPTKKSTYNIGDRVAQLIIVPYPSINFIESEELSSTERGSGGFGSSGK